MTFYYDEEENELVGNNIFFEGDYGPIASKDGDSLVIDVDETIENGRGVEKLEEIRNAANSAIESNYEG